MFQILSILAFLVTLAFSFNAVTSAIASGGSFTQIPQIVRDFYSREVFFQAQPQCRFLQFAKVKKDLQAVKGKSIMFVKYSNLTGGGSLLESDTLVAAPMVASEINIAVSEQANAVTVTEMLMRTSLMDVLGDASKALANNLAVVLDKQFRDSVVATTNVVYGGSAGTYAAMDTLAVFDSKTVKDAVEILATNNAPKFTNDQGSYYVCIAHPKQLRQLRDDPSWVNANTYMGRRQLYAGEEGMYEGVIFISTTNVSFLTSAQVVTKYGGSFSPTYACEAVIFGDNAYGWAVALDVELREDALVELGRKRTIGWYGIWGTGIIDGGNSVRILTAATA